MLGEPWWLEAHEQPEAEIDTANYAMGDPWDEALQVYTGFRRSVTVEGFLTDWLKIEAKDLDRRAQMRVSATLRAWGWIKERREEGGIRRTYWSAPANSNQGQQNTVAAF
jgi:predicted P-loop ATPase